MDTPPIVASQEWEAARRRMPWLPVERPYTFLGPDGPASLLDLFGGRRQLVVSRALYEPGVFGWPCLKEKMGWRMPWHTLTDGFDADFGVGEWHGANAFVRDGARLYRTYFVDNRGDEALGSTWSSLDITALGRQEAWKDSPEGYPQTPPYVWWDWHDAYEETPQPAEWTAQVARGIDAMAGDAA